LGVLCWCGPGLLFSARLKAESLLKMQYRPLSRIRQELGEHFQVGHSYFMRPEVRLRAGQQKIWDHAIIPLLEEYFYNRRDRESLLAEFTIEKLLTMKAQSVTA
jgi:hypothetical protein